MSQNNQTTLKKEQVEESQQESSLNISLDKERRRTRKNRKQRASGADMSFEQQELDHNISVSNPFDEVPVGVSNKTFEQMLEEELAKEAKVKTSKA